MTWTDTTWDEHMRRAAAWLATMEAHPGFKDHAQHRLLELEAIPVWEGISAMANEEKRRLKSAKQAVQEVRDDAEEMRSVRD